MAGLKTIPAVIRQIPDRTAMAVALVENIQRADLNPLEEAEALKRLIDECGLTHELTAARERPTASAACWCVRPNSRISRCSARASSSGLRSSRWMFSINAIASAASSPTGFTTTGTSASPAIWAARKRRSPAMIS